MVDIPEVLTANATDKSWLNGTYEATLNGVILDTGGENCSYRGFHWGPDQGGPYPFSASESDSFGVGVFERTSTFSGTVYFRAYARNSAGYGYGSERTLTPPPPPPDPPTVTTQAATDKSWLNGTYEATLHGTITDTGGENCDYRGFHWGPDSGGPYPFSKSDSDSFGTGPFQETSTFSGTVYFRAYAHNSAGYGYGSERTLTEPPPPPPPDPPTNVAATDGSYNSYVRVTWTKSPGATAYQVYRDGTPLGWLGDVDVHKDYGADAGSITGGSSVASDGTYVEHVALGVTGEGTSSGDTHTYKVKAKNDAGESGYSATDNGYRGVGSLSYQWYRSAGDSDASYSILSGADTENHNDTTAPENGAGRYYKCYLTASGASSKYSSPNRGYRAIAAVTMIGGPGGWTWGAPVADVSIVRITTDGGMTWAWGVASGTITIPNGGPTGWIWEEFVF